MRALARFLPYASSMEKVRAPKGFDARPRKDGSVAWTYWTYTGGKQRRSSPYDSLKAAKAAKAKYEVDIARGEYNVAPSRMTFEEVAKRFMAEGQPTRLKKTTRDTYQFQLDSRILPKLGKLKIKDIDENTLTRYFANYSDKYAPRSEWSDLVRIGQIFNYAIRRRWVTKNPVRTLEKHEKPLTPVKLERALEPDEVMALADAIDPAYRLVFLTLAASGLRVGEVRALHWSDVDLDNGTIYVNKSMWRSGEVSTPKTASSKRYVEIPPGLVELLREQRDNPDAVLEHFTRAVARTAAAHSKTCTEKRENARIRMQRHRAKERGKPMPPLPPVQKRVYSIARYKMLPPPEDPDDPYVFYWVTYPALNVQFRRACVAVGIEKPGAGGNRNHDVTLHTLRHTYGSMMVSSGLDIAVVSRMLGHKNISTTLDTYTHEYHKLHHELEIRRRVDEALGQVLVRSHGLQALPAASH